MQPDDVMKILKGSGTEQSRKIYRRLGAPDPMFGTSRSVLRPLAKKISCVTPDAGGYIRKAAAGGLQRTPVWIPIRRGAAVPRTVYRSWP
jgi:hypothetical protein